MKKDKNNKIPAREELEKLLLLAGIVVLLVMSLSELHNLQNRFALHDSRVNLYKVND